MRRLRTRRDRLRGILTATTLAAAAALLGACAETTLAVHTAKELSGTTTQPAVATGQMGAYKVGNPYQIRGVRYVPHEDYAYVEEGVASWYGPGFHGKLTANGEVYDQYGMTAAHRTLPMPSLVRVTNLENGRSLVVRINDRGPFAHNRIIDLSKRSAELLDVIRNGTARVRVEILPQESRALKAAALGRGDAPAIATAPPRASVQAASLRVSPSGVEAQVTPPPPLPTVQASYAPASTGSAGTFVQAGAFSSAENVARLERQLSGIAPVVVSPVTINGQRLLRVRLGPLAEPDAGRILDAVRAAGLPGARLVIE